MDELEGERRPIEVGDLLFDERSGELCSEDRFLRLEPKLAAVLKVLARRPGEVVSKQELLETVWKDVVVTEDVVWRSISQLRRLLGDDSKAPELIQTLPRRGYRLVPPETSPSAAAPGPTKPRVGWTAAATSAAAGLALTLLVLFGTGEPMTGDRPGAGPDPSTASADALEAYGKAKELYGKYRGLENEQSIEYYRRALAADPGFALAWAGLADAYSQRSRFHNGSPQNGEKALEAARRAVSLGPQLPECRTALGLAYSNLGRRAEAAAEYRRAVELDGSASRALANLAGLELLGGHPSKALVLLSRSLADRQLDSGDYADLATVAFHLGEYGEARRLAARALELEPLSKGPLLLEIELELRASRIDEARSLVGKALLAHRGDPNFLAAGGQVEIAAGDLKAARSHYQRSMEASGSPEAALGLVYAFLETGAEERALRLAGELLEVWERDLGAFPEDFALPLNLASVHAMTGDSGRALELLGEAVRRGFHDAGLLVHSAGLRNLHGEPAFHGLIADIEDHLARERAEARHWLAASPEHAVFFEPLTP